MKFFSSTFAAVSVLAASALAVPVAATLEARLDDATCTELTQASRPAYVTTLLEGCIEDVQGANSRDYNNLASCVAAATVVGPKVVADSLGCSSGLTLDFSRETVGHLKFDIYADIVGSCAWDQPEACSITQQNYIDFVFGTLDDLCTESWPTAEDASGWWTKITEWTKTGNVSPYHNFDDFLHYYN